MLQLLLLVATVVALALRAHEISLRPMHNDEGVNFHFIMETMQRGFYPYSHENYHGPSFFYITTLFLKIFGNNDFGLRASSIFAGICLVIFCGWMFRSLKNSFGFRAISCFLIALSPSLVFHSRYAIHETTFLLFSVVFASSFFDWLRLGKGSYLHIASASLALMIATKETFVITLFCIFVASVVSFGPKLLWSRFLESKETVFLSFLLCSFLVALVFTGGFQWYGGLSEMIAAVPQWIGRGHGDVGHFKPFGYFLNCIYVTEPYLLLTFALPFVALVFLKKLDAPRLLMKNNILGIFLGVWSLSELMVYSVIKYKTPWLIINISAPLTLWLAWWLSKGLEAGEGLHAASLLRKVSRMACLALPAIGFLWCLKYNFFIPYGAKNPYSYVHTSKGMIEFLEDLRVYWRKHPDAMVLVGVPQYWPLPYYLHNEAPKVHYLNTKDPEPFLSKYPVIIADKNVIISGRKNLIRKYYRFSDVQECQVYFRTGY